MEVELKSTTPKDATRRSRKRKKASLKNQLLITKALALSSQKYRCAYCFDPLTIEQATIDHIIPISNGGKRYNRKNICAACSHCNTVKGNRRVGKFLYAIARPTRDHSLGVWLVHYRRRINLRLQEACDRITASVGG